MKNATSEGTAYFQLGALGKAPEMVSDLVLDGGVKFENKSERKYRQE